MSKRKLDLSSALAPLENELQTLVEELCPIRELPLFDPAIDDFINKYGSSPYGSLEELLVASVSEAQYMGQDNMPLSDLLNDLLKKDA